MKVNKISILFFLIAMVSWFLCWRENFHYIGSGFLQGNIDFWKDTFQNHASSSLSYDLISLFFSISIWMFIESRKLKLKFGPIFIFMNYFVAISVSFPLFLIYRQLCKKA